MNGQNRFVLPKLMGILNVTPDSFFDGGQHFSPEIAFERARTMAQEGASIIDIGGESTKPGSKPLDVHTEITRLEPVLKLYALNWPYPNVKWSVDTRKAEVAAMAIEYGVHYVNDVSGLQADPAMVPLLAHTGAGVFINHSQGTPETMQQNPQYKNALSEIMDFLSNQTARLLENGVHPSKIWLDPGIGFGKRHCDNLDLLNSVQALHSLGYPLLYGVSRKSYIGKVAGLENSDRLAPTLATHLWLAKQGVQMLRVHDVAKTIEALIMWQTLEQNHES
jgi:dihydropteroate synthase